MSQDKKNQSNKAKKISSSNKYNNIAEVEKLVDEIILKNKERIDKIHSEEFNANHFSLKNKTKDSLFYLKKSLRRKTDEELSKKIISRARENLGEEPLIEKKPRQSDKKVKTAQKKAKDRKSRKKVVFDKKNLEKRIDTDPVEIKAVDIIKKYNTPSKKKLSLDIKTNDEKDDFVFSNEHSSQSDIADDESKLLDEQIKKAAEDTKLETNKKIQEVEKKIDEDNEGKFGDGSEKTSKFSEENAKLDGSEEVFKPRFRVENMPQSARNDDRSLTEEKIKEGNNIDSSTNELKEAEVKAQKLAYEHIKETPPHKNVQNDDFEDKKESQDFDAPVESLQKEVKVKHEHVFFDEHEESSFTGWSPNISEKEKKELSASLSGKSELDIEPPVGEFKDIELPKEVLSVDSVKLSELGFSENEWEELDYYALHKPFAFVEILRERESLEKRYFLVEMSLNEDEEKTLGFINDTINRIAIDTEELEATGGDDYLAARVDQVIDEYNLKITEESMNKILYHLSKTSLGLDKIDPLLKDPNIEDISCDGAGIPLFLYHRQFGSLKSNIKFDTEDELSSFIFKLAQKCGKHISIAEPILDATMPDGSRIQMTLSDEITSHGSTFTIRKFRSDPFSPPDLIEFNTMSAEMIAYMWLSIENGINMLFAGGTASGKTTTLNAVSLFIPPESKIVSIEETREINLPHPNWIPGVARSGFGQAVSDKIVGEIDMYDLMKAALRQRPEYIIVGEIRGREAYVLFQAMATGHATYSTVHADSAHSLIHRLESKPINIPRVMLQALDVVSLHVITKVKNKRARRCKQIIEIIDIDTTTKEILTNEVFRWDPIEDKFIYSGKSYILERIRAERDLTSENMTEELKKRTQLIELMNQSNLREFRDVARIVSKYMDSPDETLKQIQKDVKK